MNRRASGVGSRESGVGSWVTLAAVLTPGAAFAQAAAPAGPSVLPMVLAFAFVLALIPLAMWLLKKLGGAQPATAGAAGLRVVTQLALGPRERVVVVEAGDRWLLLGVTAAAISRIGTLPRPDNAHELTATIAPTASTSFRQLLQQIRAGK
jgi:flagellar protein FliO/FliZ